MPNSPAYPLKKNHWKEIHRGQCWFCKKETNRHFWEDPVRNCILGNIYAQCEECGHYSKEFASDDEFKPPYYAAEEYTMSTNPDEMESRIEALERIVEQWMTDYRKQFKDIEAVKRLAYARGYVAGHEDGVKETNENEGNL